MNEKLKSENMQIRTVFWMEVEVGWSDTSDDWLVKLMIIIEQAGVENGAMLATYLFRYTSECTIPKSNFQNFLHLRRQGGIDP